ncbi:hypothetical protein BDV29DRAFT_159077 [Aspergillus leporis]|uniref:Uncharacterized protein n=1 Tax=Aspergillus leporis TaxID=41062 RepID=A0A5N5WTN7_9EURO|nr:hypothetical protein BDV29DRAFT_159077 [Aspergillus leporis]
MPSSSASERTESVSSHGHNYKTSLSSKSDPNAALREEQPIANALAGSSMFSLRSMQHRDAKGQVITDPDRSNPTRPRLERPLDTIRGFEAAIEARRRENAM